MRNANSLTSPTKDKDMLLKEDIKPLSGKDKPSKCNKI